MQIFFNLAGFLLRSVGDNLPLMTKVLPTHEGTGFEERCILRARSCHLIYIRRPLCSCWSYAYSQGSAHTGHIAGLGLGWYMNNKMCWKAPEKLLGYIKRSSTEN